MITLQNHFPPFNLVSSSIRLCRPNIPPVCNLSLFSHPSWKHKRLSTLVSDGQQWPTMMRNNFFFFFFSPKSFQFLSLILFLLFPSHVHLTNHAAEHAGLPAYLLRFSCWYTVWDYWVWDLFWPSLSALLTCWAPLLGWLGSTWACVCEHVSVSVFACASCMCASACLFVCTCALFMCVGACVGGV